MSLGLDTIYLTTLVFFFLFFFVNKNMILWEFFSIRECLCLSRDLYFVGKALNSSTTNSQQLITIYEYYSNFMYL